MHGLTALTKIEESILDERQSDEAEADDDDEGQLLEGDVVVEEFPEVTCSDGFDAGTNQSLNMMTADSLISGLTQAQKEA